MDDQNNPQQPAEQAPVTPVVTDVTPEQEPATQPTVAPVASQPMATAPMGGMPTPKKKSRKKLALLISLIAAVLVIAGGSLAYAFYYQNPDKVITDSILNMAKANTMKAKAHVEVKGDGAELMLMVDGAANQDIAQMKADVTLKMQGETYEVTADAVMTRSSDTYVKLTNLKKLVDTFKVMAPAETHKTIDGIVAKIDGTWIKITSEDMDSLSAEESKTQKCMNETFEKLENDKEAKSELTKLYKNNSFIVVKEKLGSKDGSLGYLLEGDKDAAKGFVLGFKDTKLYKQLNDCDKSFTIDEKDINDMFKEDDKSTADVRVELWVSRFTHQVTKFSVNAKDDDMTVDMVVEPTFNKPVTVEVPKDSTTIKQLTADIEKLVKDMQASAMYAYDDEAMYRYSGDDLSSFEEL